MSTAIVNSFNIFVDSGRCITSQSTGDDIHLPLSETPIHCADNQLLRLTLQDFNMVKNFTNVNKNNSQFTVIEPNGSINEHNLEFKNYKNIHDVATAFSAKLAAACGATVTAGSVSPTSGTNAHGNSDNVISFQLDFGTNQTGLEKVIQFRIENGDIYELLGGNKILPGDAATTPSIDYIVDANDNTKVNIQCYYPAQIFTEEHIYLRTDLPSTNLETMSYSAKNSDDNNSVHINHSRILGKIPIGEAVCQFHTATGNEYTIHLQQKNFTMMNLKLTDSHGRYIPTIEKGTAANRQPTKKGNFNFKCTIKCEIVQNMGQHNNHLQTEHPQKTVSARFGTEPLPYFDYGGVRKNR